MISISFFLLQKGVYTYECRDNLEKFGKTLPEKEKNLSHLRMEDVTDADDPHTKRVCKDFEIKV